MTGMAVPATVALGAPIMAIAGDVGAGKSTVSQILESMGWALIDADRTVAALWRTPEVIAPAVGRWGDRILENGAVVHSRVAEIIFGDRAEYDWTTGLLHPLVRREMRARAAKLREEGKPVAAEIQMLFESGSYSWVTFKTFVTASREVRLKRCLKRGWNEAEVSRRESFFMPSEKRIKLSDFVIHNNGTLEDLRKSVETIIKSIQSR